MYLYVAHEELEKYTTKLTTEPEGSRFRKILNITCSQHVKVGINDNGINIELLEGVPDIYMLGVYEYQHIQRGSGILSFQLRGNNLCKWSPILTDWKLCIERYTEVVAVANIAQKKIPVAHNRFWDIVIKNLTEGEVAELLNADVLKRKEQEFIRAQNELLEQNEKMCIVKESAKIWIAALTKLLETTDYKVFYQMYSNIKEFGEFE